MKSEISVSVEEVKDDGAGKFSVRPRGFELRRRHPIAPTFGQPTPAVQLRA
jgi:hypothetical protein